jgi:hypothetical protein
MLDGEDGEHDEYLAQQDTGGSALMDGCKVRAERARTTGGPRDASRGAWSGRRRVRRRVRMGLVERGGEGGLKGGGASGTVSNKRALANGPFPCVPCRIFLCLPLSHPIPHPSLCSLSLNPPPPRRGECAQVFHSSLRYGRGFWGLVGFGSILAVVLFIAAAVSPRAVGVLVALGFVALGVCLAGAWYVYLLRRRAHAALVAKGSLEFKEGILLLPSGDMVIHFESLLPGAAVSFEIASERFLHAEVGAGFSAWTCNSQEQALVLYMHDDFGRTVTIRVPQHELVAPVDQIASDVTATLVAAKARLAP